MRVLIVSQYFPPENVPIPAAIARHLRDKGHSVRVLTGYPNYPTGKIYPGYSQRWRSRERDGSIEICRAPLYASHSQNPLARFANYSSFGLSSATASRFARGADAIYVYATQMTAALGPWLWRRLGGAPYILHVQDLWPDSIVGSSLLSSRFASTTTTLLNPWLRDVYQRAAAVIGIAPTMVEALVSRGVPPHRAHLVYNWADEQTGPEPGHSALERRAVRVETKVLYAGNMGDLQDLELAVHAAHRLRHRGLRLEFVGDGIASARLRALADELGADNVSFVGRVSPDQMPGFYGDAHYALVTLKDLAAFAGTIPSKFQAALAHGTPLITNVPGDVTRITADARVGFTARPGNGESLVQAFEAAIDQSESERHAMQARASTTYAERFSFSTGAAEIERILESVS